MAGAECQDLERIRHIKGEVGFLSFWWHNMDISGGISIFEKLFKGCRYLFTHYRQNPAHYLEGSLSSGLEVSYRIIALFEAHGVKRTQIYRLLGDRFPEIKPSLDAEKLPSILNGELIVKVSELFGVRQAWVEGEAGRMYEPLGHYKDFQAFSDFVRELKARNQEKFCFFTALKSTDASDDLYKDCPDIALFFSEPIAELYGRVIYRYYPVYGPFSWDHTPARYHLCAFFKAVHETPFLPVKGYSVTQKHLVRVSNGEAIPMHNMKISGGWYPEDYGYPQGQYKGKIKLADWKGLKEYFNEHEP